MVLCNQLCKERCLLLQFRKAMHLLSAMYEIQIVVYGLVTLGLNCHLCKQFTKSIWSVVALLV